MKHALPAEGWLVKGRSLGEEDFNELKSSENEVGVILGRENRGSESCDGNILKIC